MKRFTVEMQDAELISSKEHTHVLVEGASDTSCRAQDCKHAVAFQWYGHESHFSLLSDAVLPTCSRTCLEQRVGSPVRTGTCHQPCPKLAGVS